MDTTHTSRVVWTGNMGAGTASYTDYSRAHDIVVAGRPVLRGSADSAYRGDAARHNPEDLFVAAVAACHMLTYLALCARNGVVVVAYEDAASGVVTRPSGGDVRFEAVVLSPVVTIDDADHETLALALHVEAHERCVIANSCSASIRHVASVRIANAVEAG